MNIIRILVLVLFLPVSTSGCATTISGWKTETKNNSSKSTIEKNPSEVSFPDQTVIKFEIAHGGCNGNDCIGDRQRVELKDGYKTSLQTWGKDKSLNRFYRTNLYIPPKDQFPSLQPMKQMIHQIGLKGKNNPIWSVYYIQGGLKIDTDGAGSCTVDKKYLPREQWLEIEIHTNYSLYNSDQKLKAREAFLRAQGINFTPEIDPSFQYFINGRQVCKLYQPLITKEALRDGSSSSSSNKNKLQLKFGIYNTYPSKWLLLQPENQKWVKENDIEFTKFQTNLKGQRNGNTRSQVTSPFKYDWPVKLPTQTLYYTKWQVKKYYEDLPSTKYKKQLIERKPSGCADPVFAKLIGEQCIAQ